MKNIKINSIKEFLSGLRRYYSQTATFFCLVGFVSVLIFFIIFQLNGVFNTSITFDDSYNATISKNLVNGYGYSSSYGEIIKFNPEVTTGPAILIPVAIMIKVYGNQYWIPGMAITVIIDLLLILLVLVNWTSAYKRFLVVGIFIISLIVLLSNIYFYTLIGEVPAALFAVIAIIFASMQQKGRRYSVLAGIFSILALESKLITAFVFIPIILITLLLFIKKFDNKIFDKNNFKEISKRFLLILLGISILLIPWLTFKALSSINYNTPSVSDSTYFEKAGSGIEPFKNAEHKGAYIINNVRTNLKGLFLNNLGGNKVHIVLFFALVMTLTLLVLKTIYSERRSMVLKTESLVLGGVLLTALLHLSWWLLFSNLGWFRHVAPAIIYLGFTIVLIIFFYKNKLSMLFLALLCLAFVNNLNLVNVNWKKATNLNWDKEPRLVALLETVKEIEKLKQEKPESVFVGCLWSGNREIEYLLKTTENFEICDQINESHYKEGNVFLVTSEWSNWENFPRYNDFKTNCLNETIYSNEPFKISKCSNAP